MQVVCGQACLGGDGWMRSSDTIQFPHPRSRPSIADFQSATVGCECRALSKPWSSHSTGATVWCAVGRRRGEARPGWDGPGRDRPGQDRKQRPELWDADSLTSTSHPTTLILFHSSTTCQKTFSSTFQKVPLSFVPNSIKAEHLCWSAAAIAPSRS